MKPVVSKAVAAASRKPVVRVPVVHVPPVRVPVVASAKRSRAGTAGPVRPTAKRATSRVAPAAPKSVRGKPSARTAPALAMRLVRIKALDPCARCGPNTSVEQLYRVDEQVAGTATVHLVFFDRHGWYCVHGASCVAVRDVHAELKAQRAGAGRGR